MKWTLITGASGGIGGFVARRLSTQGKPLLLHYATDRLAAEATLAACRQAGCRAELLQAEISSVASFAAYAGEISVLVHTIGPYLVKPALKTDMAQWRALFETNFFSALALIQTLEEGLKASQGSIITMGMAGLGRRADLISPAYRLAKESLWGLTRILARELAPFAVRVNMISPGQLEGSEDFNIESPRHTHMPPAGRLGTNAEVAELVAFLLSPEASYITGQNIEVAGGYGL